MSWETKELINYGFEFFMILAMVWWVVLFMVLPIGANSPASAPEGHAQSAPDTPNIMRKMLITTAVSIPLSAVIFTIIHSGWISLT